VIIVMRQVPSEFTFNRRSPRLGPFMEGGHQSPAEAHPVDGNTFRRNHPKCGRGIRGSGTRSLPSGSVRCLTALKLFGAAYLVYLGCENDP